MREIVLNCADWKTHDDFYDAFFTAVGAPAWHGRNLDALNDSIGTGSVNQIEVPYEIVLQGMSNITGDAKENVTRFILLIRELTDKGCEVNIRIDS